MKTGKLHPTKEQAIELGHRLEYFLLQENLTQSQLAKMLGVSQNTISMALSGQRPTTCLLIIYQLTNKRKYRHYAYYFIFGEFLA